jgi:adenylate cyclase
MSQMRRLAAILAADVAGYSRLMGEDEVGTAQALSEHRAAADPLVARHGGRIVKTTGDGMLIEFSSVVGAVECSLALQKLAAERNAGIAGDRRMEWRIGIHIGDVLVEGDDILGDGVNIAARLEGIAEPGGIYISEDAFRQVRGKVGTEFADMGEQSLKNIARPLRVYRASLCLAFQTPSAPATALSLPDKPSIAVLPFANMSGDPEQEYFADGMVEEIITALSRIRWLFVIARNSSFAYRGKAVDVRQIARELGVRYVLEGSVRKASNRVRITGQLIDTTTGAHIWADRFDGLLDDIFELQDQVASSVAGVIEPALRKAEFERANRKPTESLDAYDLYLRALALRDIHTDESVAEAIGLLKGALAIDPNYAPAKALIGWSRIHQGSHGRSPASEAERAEAIALARQALDIGKDDPDTLCMAGFTLMTYAGQGDVAAAAVDRALTLNPNSALAWAVRGYVSLKFDQTGPAIDALERAMRLSPLDSLQRAFTNGIAFAHLRERRYEQALDWAEQTLREEPDYRMALLNKAVASAYLGHIEQARATVRQMIEAQPGLTIAQWSVFWSRIYSPEKMSIYVEGLRRAGVPEG